MSVSRAYYNENDPLAAKWLRNLISAGHIAPGDVDERSIEDVVPTDLVGYTQCHFFAGIACWSYALRRAGWGDDRPVWTGSCPCQPFSQAGKGKGDADERHLWPALFHLIQHGKPRGVPFFGEQVASKDGLAWLDLVQADMEGEDYTFWPLDLSASSFGAPHIRQRLYFYAFQSRVDGGAMVNSIHSGLEGLAGNGHNGHEPGRIGAHEARSITQAGATNGLADAGRIRGTGRRDIRHLGEAPTGDQGEGEEREWIRDAANDSGPDDGLAHPEHSFGRPQREHREDGCDREDGRREKAYGELGARSEVLGMADAGSERRQQDARSALGDEAADGGEGWIGGEQNGHHLIGGDGADRRPGPTNGFWATPDWLFCRDQKWRPVEPGTFPLVDRAPGRMVRLRAYGNSLCAPTAEGFIEAVIDTIGR